MWYAKADCGYLNMAAKRLIYKLEMILPKQCAQILKSYITERHFRLKQKEAYSDLKEIKAGVPQGSVLGPVLQLLYMSNLLMPENNTVATFTDDRAILAVGHSNEEVTKTTRSCQSNNWTKRWHIKLNEAKSVHMNFTNKKKQNTCW
jgi:hypothetical protein